MSLDILTIGISWFIAFTIFYIFITVKLEEKLDSIINILKQNYIDDYKPTKLDTNPSTPLLGEWWNDAEKGKKK